MAEATVSKKKKIRRSDYPYTVFKAMRNGDWITRLSFLIMGFGNIVRKQFVKGLSFLVLESIFIYFMIKNGASLLTDFFHLGGRVTQDFLHCGKHQLAVFLHHKGGSFVYGFTSLILREQHIMDAFV